MGEPLRHEDLPEVLAGEGEAEPAAEGRRAHVDVDGHFEDLALEHGHDREFAALAEAVAEGRMDDLIPPDHLMFIGGDRSNFREIGEAFRRDLIETCRLQPGHHLLDVGCGVGRLALPLAGYLSPQSSYDGFDIVADGIAWCRDNITPRFSNFRFAFADIYNEQYNAKGRLRASEFRFPYPDAVFDRVAVVSVFAHMLPQDMDHYCAEIARVMAPSALCLMSWFLLNPPSRYAVDAGLSTIDFRHHVFPNHRLMSSEVPEAAVGYDEAFVHPARQGL